MATSKFDLPEGIMIGGFAAFADMMSIIPGVGTLFLLTAWGVFKFKGISAPFPVGSMFVKVIPLVSFFAPTCTLYVWRVYKRNQPGNLLSMITDAVPNPTATVASLHLLPSLDDEHESERAKQQNKAA